MKLFKKKNWLFYLVWFCVFTVIFLLFDIIVDKNSFSHAVFDGLLHGVIITVLWWIADQASESIDESIKEDETERKRKK
jgi:hypothetical protein